MIIKKKTWPDFFRQVLSGEKKFDIRLADFECKPGDTLLFEEWDPNTEQYTGRTLEKKVTCVIKTEDLKFWPKEDMKKHGFQVMSLE